MQYADDTLLIMEGSSSQLLELKQILHLYAMTSGLKVNFSKSVMMPINISHEHMVSLADDFACSIGALPFTYLGLPLGLHKPVVKDFLPLVEKCESILLVTSNLLSQGVRLVMVNSILSSQPTFLMSTLKLHSNVIKQMDKYRKYLLWRGVDLADKKPSKAAWGLHQSGIFSVHSMYSALICNGNVR